jgi:hypothetical protein
VRVCLGGELTREEKNEWTSCVSWRLNLESGKMVVSGVIPEDDELSDFSDAENGGDYELGCVVEVPPGEYKVVVRSYPPNDLAGGWLRIEKPETFRIGFGKSDSLMLTREKPLEYFRRTRPDETPPDWIAEGYEDGDFLDFLIHLTPLGGDLTEPELEPDGCLVWQYRQPEICPVGIRLE